MAVTEMRKAEKINGFDIWEAEGFADTVRQALEIKADKKKLKAAMTVLRRRAVADKEALGWSSQLGKKG